MFLVAGFYILITGLFVSFIRRFRKFRLGSNALVQVLVLGDIGHSPRMQYHALSLANSGQFSVELIGYRGSDPLGVVLEHENITLRYLRQFSIPSSWRVPFFVYGFLKVCFDSMQLLFVLLRRRSLCVLVQTPPAVPAILVCLCVHSFVVLDFHNITYMHLASKLVAPTITNKLIISSVRVYEKYLSRFACWNFCVTNAMQKYLVSQFGIPGKKISTLHDRPGPQFAQTKATKISLESHFRKMNLVSPPLSLSEYDYILVSATSWTEDEYFSILLESLPNFSKKISKSASVLLLITGKGSGRSVFEDNFRKLNLSNIHLVTGWVSAEDYPGFLRVADVGISFHSSTSGVDLPMKIVDMLGAGLPVVAYKFAALHELLDEVRGKTFSDAEQLCECLLDLTVRPGAKERRKIASELAKKWTNAADWNSQWNEVALPVFAQLAMKQS